MAHDEAWFERILRRVKYARYSDDEYDLLTARAEKLGFDPWGDYLYLTHSTDGMQVLVRLDGLRAKARKEDGPYEKLGPFWCGRDRKWVRPWSGKRPPFCARVGIRPKGFGTAHWGLAKWDECAVWSIGERGKKILADFWQRMPDHMLAKVAEAFALRSAYPHVLGGIYTDDEIPVATPPPGPDNGMMLPCVTEDTPTSDEKFHLRLIRDHELGREDREKVISAFRMRHPSLYATDIMRFRAVVLAGLAAEGSVRQIVSA